MNSPRRGFLIKKLSRVELARLTRANAEALFSAITGETFTKSFAADQAVGSPMLPHAR